MFVCFLKNQKSIQIMAKKPPNVQQILPQNFKPQKYGMKSQTTQ